MKESSYQQKLIKILQKEGFIVVKIMSCNLTGFPDLMILKDGATIFCECKSPKKKLSMLQKFQLKKLREQGFYAFYRNSLKECLKKIRASYQHAIDTAGVL